MTRIRVTECPDPFLFDPQPQATSTPSQERKPGEAGNENKPAEASSESKPGEAGQDKSPVPNRKRRMSTGPGDDGKRQKGAESNSGLLAEIKALIDGSERRTVERFDERIGELSTRLDKRLEATEKDVKKTGRAIKELRGETIAIKAAADNDRAELPAVVNRIVGERIAAIQATSAGKRPRDGPLAASIFIYFSNVKGS